MKNLIYLACVLLLVTIVAAGQQTQSAPMANPNPSPSTTTRPGITAETSGPQVDQLKQIEDEWMKAAKNKDAEAMKRIEASDYQFVMPDGRVHDRDQDIASLNDTAFSEFSLSDVNVRVYGDTAVVTGINRIKGTEKGKDISGDYRFTDVFVNRDGTWKAVSTEATKVEPSSPNQ